MVTSCQCFMMPSSHLVSVSLDQIQLCLHSLDPDKRHHNQDDVLGWCQDPDGKLTPKQQNSTKSERKRQPQSQIRNNHTQYASNGKNNTRQVYVPFSHHPDPASYIKEYTLYESYTSGYGVYPKGRAPRQQQHALTSNKTPSDKHIQKEKTADTEAHRLGFGYYHGSTARRIPEQYFNQREQAAFSQVQEVTSPKETQQPQKHNQQQQQQQQQQRQDKHKDQQQQQQQYQQQEQGEQLPEPRGENRDCHEVLTAVQENSTVQERQANNRHKKIKLALSTRGGLDLGVRKRTPSINFTLEEYYAKQIEREMIETIQEARNILRSSFRTEQMSDGSRTDLEPAVLKLDTRAAVNSEKDAVSDETEDPEERSTRTKARYGSLVSGGNRSKREPEEKEALKLPELQKDYCCLRAKRNARHENRQHTTKRNSTKNQSQNGGASDREMAQRSPGVQNALEKNSNKSISSRNSNSEVRHSMPSLAGLYSTSDVSVRLVNPTKVVLPKLHKWLSDTALNDWNGDPVLTASKDNAPMFSREFLEYANTLKNKDIFVMLHGLQQQRKSNRRCPREVLSVPNSGQGQAAVKTPWPSVTGCAPPNTPEPEQSQSEATSGRHLSKRRNSPNRTALADRHPESCISMAQIQNNFRHPRKKIVRNAYAKTEGMYGKTLNLAEPSPSPRKVISRELNQVPVIDQKHGRPKHQTIATRMTSRQ